MNLSFAKTFKIEIYRKYLTTVLVGMIEKSSGTSHKSIFIQIQWNLLFIFLNPRRLTHTFYFLVNIKHNLNISHHFVFRMALLGLMLHKTQGSQKPWTLKYDKRQRKAVIILLEISFLLILRRLILWKMLCLKE